MQIPASCSRSWQFVTGRELISLSCRTLSGLTSYRARPVTSGYSRSVGRMLVLSLLAMLSTIVLWLIGYNAEKRITSEISGQQH